MMKLEVRSVKVRVESDIFRGGSVLKGTVHSGFSEVRTHLELESDEPEEKLLKLIRTRSGDASPRTWSGRPFR